VEEDSYVKVANTDDFKDSQMKVVEIDGESICIALINEKYYAIGNTCTHEGGPLADGKLEGYVVECPWHNSKFDIRTGDVITPPASEPEPSYETKVDGNIILVKRRRMDKTNQSSSSSAQIELELLEKIEIIETDVMSFKFSREFNHLGKEKDDNTSKLFEYNAGQYAFFDIGGVYDDPKGPIRHFTISSSPTEEDFIMFTTRIRDSPYKKRLAALEERSKVKVRGPKGHFVLHDDYSKPAIFLSGGIGVTPFRSMIKYATDKQLPLKIIMFNSNRNQDNILFKKEFDDWTNINKSLKIIYTISEDKQKGSESVTTDNDWKGEYGRIDKEMTLKNLDKTLLDNSIFYICGPPGMLKSMQSLLVEELKISKERIKVEEFTGY
jgi:ferredoxin-NADP reductase/nitrite reductase/ring-hydroxylating ferredoxin subunit